MRFPLIPDVDSRDGSSNKDERLTNVLSENDEGIVLACVRPGLALDAQASGIGKGLVRFNDELVSVYGTTLGLSPIVSDEASSADYSVGTGGLEVHLTIWLSSYRWLVAGLDFLDELAYVYTGDGEGVMNLDTDGYTGSNDMFSVATSGTSVLIGSANGSGIGGVPQVQRSLTAGALSFSDVSPGGGTQSPNGLRYYNNTYVVCYAENLTPAVIARSTDDGVTWNTATLDEAGSRDIMWDGSQWVVVGWDDDGIGGGVICWIKTSTDLVTFSPVSYTGLPVTFAVSLAVYGQSQYFIQGVNGANYELWTSADRVAWSQVSGDFRGLCVDENGVVYATTFTGGVYKSVSGVLAEVTVTPNPGQTIHISASGAESTMLGTDLSTYTRVSFADGEATIPALATVTGDYFDFAQSPA